MGLYGAIIVLPSQHPRSLHERTCTLQTWLRKLTGARQTSASRPPPTTIPKPATTASTCSSSPRWIPEFTAGASAGHRHGLLHCGTPPACSLNVATEPYHPAYFMINGRSMPDDMDPNYAPQYPHQPYNGNPHMHPGELVLLRVIGQGRWQHPFHEHGNHVRILARDGNLILSSTIRQSNLAGPLLFTTTTTPGLAMDGIFYWTGKGLNWDAYGHNPTSGDPTASCRARRTPTATTPAIPPAINYYEWCQDHNKPLEALPLAMSPPAVRRRCRIRTSSPTAPGTAAVPTRTERDCCAPSAPPAPPLLPARSRTPPADEAGFAFMWHSHNEREITTNNIFPGGMMMMMLVDSREFVIDESN